MTEHPCKGMTRAEIHAFEAIAVNHPPRCSAKTLERLLARAVIAQYEKKLFFEDGLLPSDVADFYVPLPIHIQWCEWATERHAGQL